MWTVEHEVVHEADINNTGKSLTYAFFSNQIPLTIMSTRRTKVIGSLKHMEYAIGRKGKVKGKQVFPAETSLSSKASQSASLHAENMLSQRNDDRSLNPELMGETTYMDTESLPNMGTKVR